MDAETVQHIAFTRDLPTARHTITAIKDNKDIDALFQVIRQVPVVALKIDAIEALGEIGTEKEADSLVRQLESINTAVVEGGADQQAEHRQMKKALVDAIARISAVPPPAGMSEAAISRFVSDSRRKLQV